MNRLFATACLAGWMAVMPASSQAPPALRADRTAAKAPDKVWTAPRTPDGHPDLQGIWNFATLTTLERPSELGGKQILSDQEAAEYEKQTLERRDPDRRDGSREADVGRAYNAAWWDFGKKIVGTKRTSLIVDPPDGKLPALTPEAQKRADDRAAARRLHPADGPEDRGLPERCLLWGTAGPPMMPSAYNNNFQLFQTRSHVAIFNEMIHDARIIPLDGRPHLPPGIRQWMGDSRGHWDGNTLVVDTTNFTDKTNFRGTGETLHLVERFTRVDRNTLLYEFTIHDPQSFTRPWTAAIPMVKTDELIYEYACHEGNYGMFGILKGARVEEEAAKTKETGK
jgi:hypothetical protein